MIISSDVRDCKARVRNAGKFQQFHSFDQQKNERENWLRLGAKVRGESQTDLPTTILDFVTNDREIGHVWGSGRGAY